MSRRWRRVWLWKRVQSTRTTYCIQWLDDKGHRRTEAAGTDKALAEVQRRNKEHDLNNGRLFEIKAIRLHDFTDENERLLNGVKRPETVEIQTRTLRALEDQIGNLHLESITVASIEGYRSARLSDGAAAATVNKDLRTLKSAFEKAVARGYLKANPARPVQSATEPERTIRALTPEEIVAIRAACPDVQWRVFVMLACGCGLRRGEIVWLRWEDVDLETGIVHVKCMEEHGTKNSHNRSQPLHPDWLPDLKALRGLRSSGLVLVSRDGKPWTHNLNSEWSRIVARSGVAHCTMHDLRRTFVSGLANNGVNQAVNKSLAGHSAMSTTTKYYTHVMDETKRSAVERLPYAGALA